MKKLTALILIPLAAVLSGLRIYHLLQLTEPDTGFLVSFNWSVWVFYILLAAGCLALYLTAGFPRGRDMALPLNGAGSKARGLAAGLMGLAVLVESLQDLLFRLTTDPALLHNEVAYDAVKLQGWRIAADGLGFCAAVCLLALCIQLCRGRRPAVYPALALLPAAWLACRTLLLYLEARMVITVPAVLLSVVAEACLTVWWIAHARLHGGILPEKGQRSLDMLSPVVVVLILVSVLPAGIGAFAAGTDISPLHFSDVTLACALPYVYLVARRKRDEAAQVGLRQVNA